MKLNYIGGVNGKSKLEWFWDFNIRLLKLLESKGFDIELAEKANSKTNQDGPSITYMDTKHLLIQIAP